MQNQNIILRIVPAVNFYISKFPNICHVITRPEMLWQLPSSVQVLNSTVIKMFHFLKPSGSVPDEHSPV